MVGRLGNRNQPAGDAAKIGNTTVVKGPQGNVHYKNEKAGAAAGKNGAAAGKQTTTGTIKKDGNTITHEQQKHTQVKGGRRVSDGEDSDDDCHKGQGGRGGATYKKTQAGAVKGEHGAAAGKKTTEGGVHHGEHGTAAYKKTTVTAGRRRTNQGCDDDSDDEKRFETGQVGNTKYVKDNETGNYAYGKTETGHHKGEHGAVAGKQTKYGVKTQDGHKTGQKTQVAGYRKHDNDDDSCSSKSSKGSKGSHGHKHKHDKHGHKSRSPSPHHKRSKSPKGHKHHSKSPCRSRSNSPHGKKGTAAYKKTEAVHVKGEHGSAGAKKETKAGVHKGEHGTVAGKKTTTGRFGRAQ